MLWIYDLPNWLLCAAFVCGLAAAALGGHRLWRRLGGPAYDEETRGLAMGMLGMVAMVLSLLLAFSSVSVWEAHTGAAGAADAEASVAGELVRDLAVYGGPAAGAAREAVRSYLRAVVADEWPSMSSGDLSEAAGRKFDDIFHRAGALKPRGPREEALLAEIWDKANELNVHRRARLDSAGGSAVPGALWGTIALCMLFNFLLFYGMPVSRAMGLLLGIYAGTLGLLLFFITAMDRPYTGSVSLSPAPYEAALRSMERWDSEPEGGKKI